MKALATKPLPSVPIASHARLAEELRERMGNLDG